MSLEVYINDEQIELKAVDIIGLTFQVGSILNPQNRAGNLSNKFAIPKSAKNIQILGDLSNLNSSNNLPYVRNSAKLVQNGVELIPDGFAIIEEASDDYKITLYSGNVSFFDLIKDATIRDLDYSDLIHAYDIATIIASFSGTSEYQYPIIEWGEEGVTLLSNLNNVNSQALIMCLTVKSVLERSAQSVGYELKGSFTERAIYSRLILTPDRFQFTQAELLPNKGTATDVTDIPETEEVIEGEDTTPTPIEKIILPLLYNTVNWDNYDKLTQKFVPDNIYKGTFKIEAVGNIRADMPVTGEVVIDSGNDNSRNIAINDTHIGYVEAAKGTSDRSVYVYDIVAEASTLIETFTLASNLDIGLTITESTDGYIAYSAISGGVMVIKLYDISGATPTTIYTASGSTLATNLKIYNGRLSWTDLNTGGGIFMYDIASATTKQVTTSIKVDQTKVDHDGENLTYFSTDSLSRQVRLWDYTSETEVIVKAKNNLTPIDLRLQGDFITFHDQSAPRDVHYYKISTGTLSSAFSSPSAQIFAVKRTDTLLSFADNNTGKVYVFNMTTATLTDTGESDARVIDVDDIQMNDRYVVYIAKNGTYNDNKIKYYDISGASITTVQDLGGNTDTINKCVLTFENDVIVYHSTIFGSGIIRQYDIDTANFATNITNAPSLIDYDIARDNDRIAISIDDPASGTFVGRASYINTDFTEKSVRVRLSLKEDGSEILSDESVYTGDFNKEFTLFILQTIVVKELSEYTVELNIVAKRDSGVDYSVFYSLDTSSFAFTTSKQIQYGSKITPSNIYVQKQKDIYKDVMNQYSLFVQTDEIKRELILTPLDEILNNTHKAIDWSEKINLNKAPKITFRISGYAQKNYFNYAEDDLIPLNFARGSIDINDSSLEPESDLVTLSVAAVEDDSVLSPDPMGLKNVPRIPFKSAVDSSYENQLGRILLLDKQDETMNFFNSTNSDTGQAIADIPFCYFSQPDKSDSLDFTSIIAANYNALSGMVNQPKLIEAEAILNEADIRTLDFSIPIKLDIHYNDIHINGFFYINKISNFKNNKGSKVELIRL